LTKLGDARTEAPGPRLLDLVMASSTTNAFWYRPGAAMQ